MICYRRRQVKKKLKIKLENNDLINRLTLFTKLRRTYGNDDKAGLQKFNPPPLFLYVIELE